MLLPRIDWLFAPLFRLAVRLTRDLRVHVDFALSCSACDHKVLFLDAANRVRRGAMFVTNSRDPVYGLLVSFIDRSVLAERGPRVATNFVRFDDQHTRWTYGWCNDAAKALRAAEALR